MMIEPVEMRTPSRHTTPHPRHRTSYSPNPQRNRKTMRSGSIYSRKLPAASSWIHHVFALVNSPVFFITPAASKATGDVKHIASPVKNIASPASFIAGVYVRLMQYSMHPLHERLQGCYRFNPELTMCPCMKDCCCVDSVSKMNGEQGIAVLRDERYLIRLAASV
jgi:hypothetical protein